MAASRLHFSLAALAVATALLAGTAAVAGVVCDGAPGEAIASGRVKADRVYFVANADSRRPNCPSADIARRLKSFLVRGNEVLVSPSDALFLCATFKSRSGVETSGFLPAAALDLAAAGAPAAREWVGSWRKGKDGSIDITARGDGLAVEGQATWTGDATTNTGEISGEARPRDGVLVVGYDPQKSTSPPKSDNAECAARLRLISGYLVVDDNGNCGGLNVSFDGIYVRVK